MANGWDAAAGGRGEWRVNGSREASGASRALACCLLPDGGSGGGSGGYDAHGGYGAENGG